MKKPFIIVALLMLSSLIASAQGLVVTTNGRCYVSEEPFELEKGASSITVNEGRRLVRIPMEDIVLYEDVEKGSTILRQNMIRENYPLPYNDKPMEYFAEGKRVYVPVSSSRVVERYGRIRLAKLVAEAGYWTLFGCANEADFILEYVFDDSGHDHAYLLFSDGQGNPIGRTSSIGASDWVPSHAGEDSAEALYKRHIKKGSYAGKWRLIPVK